MLTTDFDYYLPENLIAQHPCEPRDHSRLMVLDRHMKKIEHRRFYNLVDYLSPGDTLVFNDTKVIPARLLGRKADTGAKIEVFLLNRLSNEEWEVLVKPGRKARKGATIIFGDELKCEILTETDYGGRTVRFIFRGVFEQILDKLGEVPLPPYIKETLTDKERYQTVYAKHNGSAAAPTAGLHFTNDLFKKLTAKGINSAFITLHVGLGTFRPVSTESIDDHVMHREFYSLSKESAEIINKTKSAGKRIVAVGTTSVRTLETVGKKGTVTAQSGWTNIFIYPGHKFQIVDALITNFHLPKSTLLMLVSAFAGYEFTFEAYRQAIELEYRFFSFGDAMLIL